MNRTENYILQILQSNPGVWIQASLFDSAGMPGGPGVGGWGVGNGGFTVEGCVGRLGNRGVCVAAGLLLELFVEQNSCCVIVWWKPPGPYSSLCNHRKRTYQRSGSITHPRKHALMSVNEAELQPPKSETWLSRRRLMEANNGAEP